MFVAFAIRTEPELEFMQIMFCATELQSKQSVAGLCEQFADDPSVETDWVSFPEDSMPSSEHTSEPAYLESIHRRIVEAYFGEPEWMTDFP